MIEVDWLLGQTLDGKYRLEEKLGQGGMGAVFRATHLGTDRVVALKLIAPGLMDQEDFVQRFHREARATGRLRHPNIVDLTDFGFAEVAGRKLAYLVMEFLQGETLGDLLKRNPAPPLPFVVDLVQQVCSALQEAHGHGIVHRDLKPDNLWLEPDRRGGQRVKILDFGLAKLYDPKSRAEGGPGLPVADGATELSAPSLQPTEALPADADPLRTEVGTRLGTPAYMSPEQCRAVALDHRSDLYSLGVIIYQMLSGRPPFEGGSLDLINQHIQAEVPDLRELRKDLPSGTAELVMECLAKDPRKRPASAEILGNALEAYALGEWSLIKTGLGLYIDLFLPQWSRCIRPFLPPLAVALVFLLYAIHLESPLAIPGGPGPKVEVRILLDEIGFLTSIGWLWMGWMIYAFNRLAGSITPLVLRKLLQPLAPVNPEELGRDQAAFRAYHLYNLLSSLPMVPALVALSLVLRGSILFLTAHPGRHSMQSTLTLAVLAVVVLISGSLLVLSVRLNGGVSSEGMASLLFLEGGTLAESRARLKELRRKAHIHIKGPRFLALDRNALAITSRRDQVDAGPGGSIAAFLGFCFGVFVFCGLKVWDRLLPMDLHFAIGAFIGWQLLWLTPFLALLAPLTGIFSALTYLRLRKIARESMTEAYKGFEARLGGA